MLDTNPSLVMCERAYLSPLYNVLSTREAFNFKNVRFTNILGFCSKILTLL